MASSAIGGGAALDATLGRQDTPDVLAVDPLNTGDDFMPVTASAMKLNIKEKSVDGGCDLVEEQHGHYPATVVVAVDPNNFQCRANWQLETPADSEHRWRRIVDIDVDPARRLVRGPSIHPTPTWSTLA